MEISRRGFLKAMGCGVTSILLPSCTTSVQNRTNTNKVPKETLDVLCEVESPIVDEIAIAPSTHLVGEKAERIKGIYGDHIPSLSLDLYFANQYITQILSGEEIVERRPFDSTGNINQCLDEIAAVEADIPEKSQVKGVAYGDPGWNETVSSRGADNKLSKHCGLLGIRNHFTDGEGFFFVEVDEKTGINGLFRETERYDIKITFGQEAYKAIKRRKDPVYAVKAAGATAIGFAVAGVPGAIGTAAQVGIDAIWSYAEGRQVPRDTLIIDGRTNVSSVDDRVSDTYRTFETADRLGANSVIVYKHQGGTALIYGGNMSNVRTKEMAVMFETDTVGAHFFDSMLYDLTMAATRYHGSRRTKTEVIKLPCPGYGGGEIGGPGGSK